MIEVREFDLKHTFESAQPLTFYADYSKEENSLSYASGGTIIKVSFKGTPQKGQLNITSNDILSAKAEVKKRFRLDDDMEKIYKRINTDVHVGRAIDRYEGMRLTVNDPWETTVCFIISQFNNVKRIRLIVRKIIERYGRDIIDNNGKVAGKSFPKSEDLLKVSEKNFLACGAGFRAKYLVHAADYCTNNLNLYKLNPNNYGKLKEELMEIQGVGDKVADCIALMGYGNLNAFPIDVHVKRAMERLYFNGEKKKIKEIHEISDRMWDAYRGYAQQYLFHNERTV
ncbi:MAG: hypothetical protein LVQ95_05265 [Candidatus Micrarchaeales archaeon]|nr:hypothetical protein [Candidatus Micrarchaeales archaeon]